MTRDPRYTITSGVFRYARCTGEKAWYYMWIGSKWNAFNIHTLAKSVNTLPPVLNGLLEREALERVAAWCKTINAQDYIKR